MTAKDEASQIAVPPGVSVIEHTDIPYEEAMALNGVESTPSAYILVPVNELSS